MALAGQPRWKRLKRLGAYAAEWIAGRHDLAMRTRQDYEDLLRLHLRPALGTTRWRTSRC